MTNIVFEIGTDEIKIDMSGHAGFAEKGNDIVCSAISTIEYIITSYASMNPDKGYLKRHDAGAGYSIIRIIPASDEIYAVIEAAVLGLMGLEESYPEYINLKKIWKSGRNKKVSPLY